MRYEKTVILTDLDGTLFNSHGLVSKEDRAAIADYMARGGLFGVATGREPGNARVHLPDFPMNAPSIVLNGAAVYDFQEKQYLKTILMDKEAALQVLAHCQSLSLPLDVQVYTTEGIFYATPLETADPGFLRIHQPTRYLPMEELVGKEWMKVCAAVHGGFPEGERPGSADQPGGGHHGRGEDRQISGAAAR